MSRTLVASGDGPPCTPLAVVSDVIRYCAGCPLCLFKCFFVPRRWGCRSTCSTFAAGIVNGGVNPQRDNPLGKVCGVARLGLKTNVGHRGGRRLVSHAFSLLCFSQLLCAGS